MCFCVMAKASRQPAILTLLGRSRDIKHGKAFCVSKCWHMEVTVPASVMKANIIVSVFIKEVGIGQIQYLILRLVSAMESVPCQSQGRGT